MKIAIAGPYSAPTGKERQENLDAMNEAAVALYEMGHIPLIGVNAALPVLEKSEVDDEYKLIMDISMAVVESCDSLLLLKESPGANRERDLILSLGKPVYKSLEEVPAP
ncbi:MAG: DUF4406 domain-containing protein [Chitinophagales bacterium]|nr:DUF4406 domain-containing protein [Chitinophagales bacterium]